MTKAEVVKEIAKRTGIKRETVDECVDCFIRVIKDALADGQNIYFRGFGSFIVKRRAEKKARDMGNNTSIIVPAHNIPAFKPCKELKKLVH